MREIPEDKEEKFPVRKVSAVNHIDGIRSFYEIIRRQSQLFQLAAEVGDTGMGEQFVGDLLYAHAADLLQIKDLLRFFQTLRAGEIFLFCRDGQCLFHDSYDNTAEENKKEVGKKAVFGEKMRLN